LRHGQTIPRGTGWRLARRAPTAAAVAAVTAATITMLESTD